MFVDNFPISLFLPLSLLFLSLPVFRVSISPSNLDLFNPSSNHRHYFSAISFIHSTNDYN